jgi:ribosomal protein S18 acetylase RimI-like enzyme
MSAVQVAALTEDDVAAVAADLALLLPQVSSRAAPLTADRVRQVLQTPSTTVFVARLNGRIVGMALLLTLTTLAGDTGYVEEVVVDEAARGQHVSTMLMRALIAEAERAGLRCLELTTRPSRQAANSLYQALGFARRDTNCYRLDLG